MQQRVFFSIFCVRTDFFNVSTPFTTAAQRSTARHCLQKHTEHSRMFTAATALLHTTAVVSTTATATAQLQFHTFPMYALRKHFFPRLHFVRCFVVVNVLHSFTQTLHTNTHTYMYTTHKIHLPFCLVFPVCSARFGRCLCLFCRYRCELLLLLLFYLFPLQLFCSRSGALKILSPSCTFLLSNSILSTNFLLFAIYICTFMSHFTLSSHLFLTSAGGLCAMLKNC